MPDKPANLATFLSDVKRFARTDYTTALARGDALDAATRASVVAKLHAYLGLSPAYIDLSNLRISPERFEKELLRERRETVGRLDGRYVGNDLDAVADSPDYDPTDAAISGPFTATFNRYVRDELKWTPEGEYKATDYAVVNRSWDFKRQTGGELFLGVNVAGDLASAMTKNPHLRVFSANGYYDLATPFYATEYTLGHLGLAPALAKHLSFGSYPSGHMIYMNPASLVRLKADLVSFYASAMR